MSAELIAGLALKALGAAAGAFMSLVFMPPKTRRELWTRGSFTLVAGVIFAPQVAGYLSWIAGEETTIASAAAAAFVSWWGLGAIARGMRLWALSKMDATESSGDTDKPLN